MAEYKFKIKTADGRTAFIPLELLLKIFEQTTGMEAVSIKQLCFRDKNDAEVYEDDVVELDFGSYTREYSAHYEAFATTEDGCYIGHEDQFRRSRLKTE